MDLSSPRALTILWASLMSDNEILFTNFLATGNWDYASFAAIMKSMHTTAVFNAAVGKGKNRELQLTRVCQLILTTAKGAWLRPATHLREFLRETIATSEDRLVIPFSAALGPYSANPKQDQATEERILGNAKANPIDTDDMVMLKKRLAAFYLLYTLYFKQPYANEIKIPMTLVDYESFEEFEKTLYKVFCKTEKIGMEYWFMLNRLKIARAFESQFEEDVHDVEHSIRFYLNTKRDENVSLLQLCKQLQDEQCHNGMVRAAGKKLVDFLESKKHLFEVLKQDDEECAAAKAQYDEACAASKSKYDEASGAPKAEYAEARPAPKAEYDEASAAPKAEYAEARPAPKAEYDEASAAPKAEYAEASAAPKAKDDKEVSSMQAQGQTKNDCRVTQISKRIYSVVHTVKELGDVQIMSRSAILGNDTTERVLIGEAGKRKVRLENKEKKSISAQRYDRDIFGSKKMGPQEENQNDDLHDHEDEEDPIERWSLRRSRSQAAKNLWAHYIPEEFEFHGPTVDDENDEEDDDEPIVEKGSRSKPKVQEDDDDDEPIVEKGSKVQVGRRRGRPRKSEFHGPTVDDEEDDDDEPIVKKGSKVQVGGRRGRPRKSEFSGPTVDDEEDDDDEPIVKKGSKVQVGGRRGRPRKSEFNGPTVDDEEDDDDEPIVEKVSKAQEDDDEPIVEKGSKVQVGGRRGRPRKSEFNGPTVDDEEDDDDEPIVEKVSKSKAQEDDDEPIVKKGSKVQVGGRRGRPRKSEFNGPTVDDDDEPIVEKGSKVQVEDRRRRGRPRKSATSDNSDH